MTEVDEVKTRLDIVEVVGGYVPLQRAGRTYKGLCPFHSEKTPSFVVSPERQSWHCFGACGTGGDVISFVMQRERIDFREALTMLAARAGVPLRERQARPEQQRLRDRIQEANEAAARWYHQMLGSDPSAEEARRYVEKRRLDEAAVRAFLIGYSPPGWEGTRKHLRERGFSDAELLAAGLLIEGERGPYDRFRGRLMFPIRDGRGRFVGFGARALDESVPKYLNTPQTQTFDKGGMLYALDVAQDGIRRADQAVIVEGYMDVIAAHQRGFDNVVASMGTSLTERQVRLLKRHTRNIVLALDADTAGSEATLRGHEVVEEALRQSEERDTVPVVTWRGLVRYQDATSVDLRVAVLPQERDPDDIIRSDPDAWTELIGSAPPVLDYRFHATADRHDLSTPQGRSGAVQELLPLLEPVTDPVVRAHYLQRLSRLSLVKEEELSRLLGRQRSRRDPGGGRGSRPGDPAQAESAGGAPSLQDRRVGGPEAFLVALLLRFPGLRKAGLDIREEIFWDSANREVLKAWKSSPELDTVKEGVAEELNPHLERLLHWRMPEFSAGQAETALADCVGRLERRSVETERREIGSLLATREEELGASALAEAAAGGAEPEDEAVREAVSLHQRELETGIKLHGIRLEREERKESNGDTAEATIDG